MISYDEARKIRDEHSYAISNFLDRTTFNRYMNGNDPNFYWNLFHRNQKLNVKLAMVAAVEVPESVIENIIFESNNLYQEFLEIKLTW